MIVGARVNNKISDVYDNISVGDVISCDEVSDDEKGRTKTKVYYRVTKKHKNFFLVEKVDTGRKSSFLYSALITGEVKKCVGTVSMNA